MQANGNLFTRDDTFFGACQGAGEDTGIPPSLFRLAFAFMLFWNPAAALGAYAALGVAVALARFLFPAVRAPQAAAAEAAAAAAPAAAEPEAVMACYAADLEPVEADGCARTQAEPVRLAA